MDWTLKGYFQPTLLLTVKRRTMFSLDICLENIQCKKTSEIAKQLVFRFFLKINLNTKILNIKEKLFLSDWHIYFYSVLDVFNDFSTLILLKVSSSLLPVLITQKLVANADSQDAP